MSSEIYDVIIVGAGPAGLTAGIYLSRARLKTLIFEKMLSGGLATSSDMIENYPGFVEGINGIELGKKMEEQARRFGTEIIFEEVKDFKKEENFVVVTDKREYESKALIIATGSHYKKLNVPNEYKFIGRGISFCATCDAPFFKDKEIVVIGTGNSGLQEGLHLLKYVKRITFIEYLPYITGEKILQERLPEEKTEFLLNKEVLSFEGEKRLEGVKIRDRKTGEVKIVKAEGAFLFVGLVPNTDFLKSKIELDKNGFIITDEKLQTSIEGIFAIGDVRNSPVKQVATAVGDGAFVSKFVKEYIEKKEVR